MTRHRTFTRATPAQLKKRRARVLQLHKTGITGRAQVVAILLAEGIHATENLVKHDRQTLKLQPKVRLSREQIAQRKKEIEKWANTAWNRRTERVCDIAKRWNVTAQAITNTLARMKRTRTRMRMLHRASEAATMVCVLGHHATTVAKAFNVAPDTIRRDLHRQNPNWTALRDAARRNAIRSIGGAP